MVAPVSADAVTMESAEAGIAVGTARRPTPIASATPTFALRRDVLKKFVFMREEYFSHVTNVDSNNDGRERDKTVTASVWAGIEIADRRYSGVGDESIEVRRLSRQQDQLARLKHGVLVSVLELAPRWLDADDGHPVLGSDACLAQRPIQVVLWS